MRLPNLSSSVERRVSGAPRAANRPGQVGPLGPSCNGPCQIEDEPCPSECPTCQQQSNGTYKCV